MKTNKLILAILGGALFLSGCGPKAEVAYIDLYRICHSKEVPISISGINSDSGNDLNIPSQEVRESLLRAMRDTNCFDIQNNIDGTDGYVVDVNYASALESDKVKKNIALSEENTYAIVNVTITLINRSQTRNYTGKGRQAYSDTKLFGLGSERAITRTDARKALDDAIRIAIKEAAEDLKGRRR